jgi:hypothetical protein
MEIIVGINNKFIFTFTIESPREQLINQFSAFLGLRNAINFCWFKHITVE